MKIRLMVLGLLLILLPATSFAALTTIGTATYLGNDYNLIWDDDNNGNSVVWLDYTNAPNTWDNQVAWASGLNGSGVLTCNTPGYTVDWEGSWRLPTAVDGAYTFGYDGTTMAGYNITSSEMGHLYYEELGNLGRYDTSGNEQPGYGLTETGDFENLSNSPYQNYWSGTERSDITSRAWFFYMSRGGQDTITKSNNHYGIAIRSGQVSAVPVPGSVVLLGAGLMGMSAFGRRKEGTFIDAHFS